MEKVSVIIPTYSNLEGLERCNESIQSSTYKNISVTVVNNGNSRVDLKNVVHWINTGTNVGFAKACNIGAFAAAQRCNPDYLFFLNDDCVLDPNCIIQLVCSLKTWWECIAVSPLIREGTTSINFAGGRVHRQLGFCTHIKDIHWTNYKTEYLTGAAFMIRAKDFPGFDESFFMYWEDVDLSLRLRETGRSIMVDPFALVLHEVSQTTKNKWKMWFYSGIKFHKKWSGFNPVPWIGFFCFSVLKYIKGKL